MPYPVLKVHKVPVPMPVVEKTYKHVPGVKQVVVEVPYDIVDKVEKYFQPFA